MSDWMKDCFYGRLDKIKKHLEEEPRLLDRRESLLRLNGLMHVIQGFRLGVGQIQSSEHLECVNYLLKKGTPVDCKDFLGHTPLHQCTGAFGNKSLFKIAKCLLEKGADINIENRFGCSPLVEPAFALNMDCVNWLLENGADPIKAKLNGVSLYEDSRKIPPLRAAMDKHVKKKKQEAFKEGSYRSCGVCKKKTHKRCTGCFLSWYCTKECQESAWKDHKDECKRTQSEYVKIELKQHNYNTLVSFTDHSTVSYIPSTKLRGRSNFVVKIQVGEGDMLVYNEGKTICGSIVPEMACYQEVLDNIKEHGVVGRKAYFYATWKEGEGLKINVKRVQPPETW